MPRRNGTGPPWWHGRLQGCGYRLTMSRQVILDILNKTSRHLSAEEVYLAAKKVYPAIGLTTIYRTLEILVDMGVVFKSNFGDGRARYELVASQNKEEHHHHHLVCISCNRVVDYTDFINEEIELLKKTEKSLSKKYNFKINSHLIQFYGLCDKCKKE